MIEKGGSEGAVVKVFVAQLKSHQRESSLRLRLYALCTCTKRDENMSRYHSPSRSKDANSGVSSVVETNIPTLNLRSDPSSTFTHMVHAY